MSTDSIKGHTLRIYGPSAEPIEVFYAIDGHTHDDVWKVMQSLFDGAGIVYLLDDTVIQAAHVWAARIIPVATPAARVVKRVG